MSFTTLRRRKHKSLEALSKGKENVDLLLMQASQVYSATSHWQSQIDAADGAKQEAVSLLETVQNNLQVTLHGPGKPSKMGYTLLNACRKVARCTSLMFCRCLSCTHSGPKPAVQYPSLFSSAMQQCCVLFSREP